MQVQVHFTFQNEEEFVAFSNKFAGGAVKLAPEPTKVKVDNKPATMNEKLAAKAAAEDKTPVEKTEDVSQEEPAEATFDAVKTAVLLVSKQKGRDAAVAVLAKFNVKKVGPELAEKDYAGVIAECNKVMAAE